MPLVLVHGGGFDGSCWDRIVPLLHGTVRALDLPGRRSRPADLDTVTVEQWADAVVDEILADDRGDVVLVGHSLAGITLPRVIALVADRLRHVVFVACVVPPHGGTVGDELAALSPATAAVVERIGGDVVTAGGTLHPDLATAMFCNDMDDEQRSFTLAHLVPEAIGVMSEPTDLRGLSAGVPCTYLRLLQDASLTPETQLRMAANLGVVDIIDLDAGHMAMISRPAAVAQILNSL